MCKPFWQYLYDNAYIDSNSELFIHKSQPKVSFQLFLRRVPTWYLLTYHYFLSSLTFWDCKWDPLPLRWICLWPSFYFPLPLFDNPIVSWWHPITKSWAVEHPISCTLSNSSHSLQQISNACTLCTVRAHEITFYVRHSSHIFSFI